MPRAYLTPAEVYAHFLTQLNLGYALWYPEPHDSGEPQIGDVGYILDGAFVRLFNLQNSEEKNVHHFGSYELPEPLPPRVIKVDSRSRPLVPKLYHSHGVERKQIGVAADVAVWASASAGFSVGFECSALQGAALELQSEAHAESIYDNRILKKYIVRNHDRWYAYFADKFGLEVAKEDLVVLSGWVKTSADWAAAAFSSEQGASNVAFYGAAGSFATLRVMNSHAKSRNSPMLERHGAAYPLREGFNGCAPLERNQCAFIKRYKVRRRLWFLRKVVAGAGYHHLSGPDPDQDGIEGIGDQLKVKTKSDHRQASGYEVWDPVDILLAYMLEVTNADTAIASDNDVASITGDLRIIDFASYLRHAQPHVEVDDNLAWFSMEDVILQERQRALARSAIRNRDLIAWPKAVLKGAAELETSRVSIGSIGDESMTFKSHYLTFTSHQRHSLGFKCYALSQDGKLLAGSPETGQNIIAWRALDGLRVQVFKGHTDHVKCLVFSPDGRTLVSGAADCTAIAWDVRSGTALLLLEGHNGPVDMVVYAPSGQLIVTGSAFHGDSIKIWDASNGACLHAFTMLQRDMHRLVFSPDSARLYIGLNYSCLIYDARKHKNTAILRHRYGKALDWTLTPQGDRLATAARPGGDIKVWCAITGRQLLSITYPSGLTSPIAFTSDGGEVTAVCDEDMSVLTYDARTGKLQHVYGASHVVTCLAYSQDGAYLALGGSNGWLTVLDGQRKTVLATYKDLASHRALQEISFLPDNKSVVARPVYGPLCLVHVKDAERLR